MIAALVGAALASGIAPEEVPFEQIVTQSNTIVIAHPADPPARQETRVFAPQEPKVPDYTYSVTLFVVDTIVADGRSNLAGATLAVGQTIAVIDPMVSLSEGMHEMYHAHGVSEWVVVPMYKPVAPVGADGKRILFVSPGTTPTGAPAYVLTVSDAYEGLDRLKAVEKLLKKAE